MTGISAAKEKASETPLNSIKKSNKMNWAFLLLLKNLKIKVNTEIELFKLIKVFIIDDYTLN